MILRLILHALFRGVKETLSPCDNSRLFAARWVSHSAEWIGIEFPLTAQPQKVTDRHLLTKGSQKMWALLEFSKAFDSVWHSILLDKISTTHVDKSIICWMKSWLGGQAQRVTINGVASNWKPVPTEVPQGSVICTVGFNAFYEWYRCRNLVYTK